MAVSRAAFQLYWYGPDVATSLFVVVGQLWGTRLSCMTAVSGVRLNRLNLKVYFLTIHQGSPDSGSIVCRMNISTILA